MPDLFTRYGNWVATTRFPTARHVRRLAASNPTDYGKYVFYATLVATVPRLINTARIRALQKELERERAKAEEVPRHRRAAAPVAAVPIAQRMTDVEKVQALREGFSNEFSAVGAHAFRIVAVDPDAVAAWFLTAVRDIDKEST